MAAGDLTLAIAIKATDMASGVIRGIGSAFGPVGAGMATLAIGAAAAGVEAVKMAGDFQSATTTLVTSAGESARNLDMVRQGILNLSVSTATSTDQLVQGMYMIESAGWHGADGLRVLQAAAEGARAENASLGTVANAVTGVMTDYHLKVGDAVSVTNALVTTVANGKTHMQDLAASMGAILPIASANHISFQDVGAAIASMTNHDVSAQQAAQNLAFTIRSLAAPNAQAVKYMTAVGLTAQELKDKLSSGGLVGAISMISDAVGKKFPASSVEYTTAMKKIMGGAVGLNTELMLGGENMAGYRQRITAIGDALHTGGNAVMGWSEIQGNFNFKMDQAKAGLDALMIALGTKLLPVLTPIIGQVVVIIGQFSNWITTSGTLQIIANGLSNAISFLVGFFRNLVSIGTNVVKFFQQNQWAVAALIPLIGALGGVLALFAASAAANAILSMLEFGLSIATAAAEAVTGAVVMTTTFSSFAGMMVTSMGAAAASTFAVIGPFLLIGAIIAVVVIGIILIIKNWGTIGPWLQGVWSGVVSFFQAAMQRIGQAVSAVVAWFNQWKPLILGIGGAIALFVGPALIGAGVAAVTAGGQIAASFIANLVASGAAAAVQGARVAATFVASIAQAGVQAVLTGAKFVASLIPAIISFGVTAVTTAATAIPAMIAGFISWAVAGWAAAAATIAATWPILLIILGIAALIAVIILLVTHWSQVTQFLKSAWQATTTWLASSLHATGAFFGAVFSAIGTTVHNAVVGIGNWFSWLGTEAQSKWNGLVNGIKGIVTGIGNWLKSTWQTIVSTVVGWFLWLFNHNYYFHDLVVGIMVAFTLAKNFITNLWNTITSWLVGKWNGLKSTAQTVWNGIVTVINTVALDIWNFLRGIWETVTGWIVAKWTYLKTMAEVYFMFVYMTIQQRITQVKDFLVGIWTTIVNWITTQWTLLKLRAEIYFMLIYVTIQQRILQVQSFVMSILTAIGNFFVQRWDNLVANTTSLWQRISSIFSSAWSTYISGPISSLWNNIWSAISGWAQKAFQAGANFVSMIAQGITSGVGQIWSAVSNIAGTIWKGLGFHSPAEAGPGADADRWMPNLINMLSVGLVAGVPQMQRAVLQAAGPLSLLSGGTSGNNRAFALSGGNNNQAFALSGGGGNQTIVIQMQPQDINLDKQKVGTAVSKVQVANVRRAGYRNG